MNNYNLPTAYEENEQPIDEKYMDFVIDHIPGYQDPRELGESISYAYNLDTAWQVVPVSSVVFTVQNNDDMSLQNIHQRYYKMEMFMDNGPEPKLPMILTMVDGENTPGNSKFYFQVDDEVEVPADKQLVQHFISAIDDFNLPKS